MTCQKGKCTVTIYIEKDWNDKLWLWYDYSTIGKSGCEFDDTLVGALMEYAPLLASIETGKDVNSTNTCTWKVSTSNTLPSLHYSLLDNATQEIVGEADVSLKNQQMNTPGPSITFIKYESDQHGQKLLELLESDLKIKFKSLFPKFMTISIECETNHLSFLKDFGYENQSVNELDTGGYDGYFKVIWY